eukprot:1444560-Alexandrium_andersonii.AAC.1
MSSSSPTSSMPSISVASVPAGACPGGALGGRAGTAAGAAGPVEEPSALSADWLGSVGVGVPIG